MLIATRVAERQLKPVTAGPVSSLGARFTDQRPGSATRRISNDSAWSRPPPPAAGNASHDLGELAQGQALAVVSFAAPALHKADHDPAHAKDTAADYRDQVVGGEVVGRRASYWLSPFTRTFWDAHTCA